MTWVKMDDRFPDHPKVLALGDDYDAGISLHVRGLCYCAANLTDGFIPARKFAPEHGMIERLVAVGLWHEVGGGYEVHDYLDYNPSKEKVLDGRRKDSDRKARILPSGIQTESERNPDGIQPSRTPSPKDLKHSTSKAAKKNVYDYPTDFLEFWELYPRPTGKAASFRAWNARLKEGHTPDTILDGTRRYVAYTQREGVEQHYTKMPATFLGPDLWFTEKWEPKRKKVDW